MLGVSTNLKRIPLFISKNQKVCNDRLSLWNCSAREREEKEQVTKTVSVCDFLGNVKSESVGV